MRTIDTVIAQLTDPHALYETLLETLRITAAAFSDEEKRFSDAVTSLRSALSSKENQDLETYLTAATAEISAIMVYTGWLGFQLNLNCWRNPINKLVFEQDYEEITQERTFEAIPSISHARRLAEISAATLSGSAEPLLSDISSYFAYLYTAAPKLAHLFGFRLADKLLYHFNPGYQPDTLLTRRYELELKEYLAVSSLH